MNAIDKCPQCYVALPTGTTERLCPNCRTDLMVYRDPSAPQRPLIMVLPSVGEPSPLTGDSRFFGNYELLHEVARGGMGVVFKARQVSLNRVVALKMIRGERLLGAEDLRRFHVEAKAAAQLHHRNIVPIHEVGEFEGQHFYSMDFIEGESLSQIAREHPLPPKQAARYVQKIALAIHYAHSRQILHRDLKPANVLIDGDDEPQVTDFGLAKVLEAESGMTMSGTIVGSPSYMPPEQASGDSRSVGVRSDVYGLGTVLYELLCGRPPFRAETAMETMRQVIEKDPPPPRLLNGKVPRDLETICLKCLEKSPDRRFASAQELAEELLRFENDEPILARPVSPAARVVRWCRRKPALAVSSAAALLAICVILVGSPVAAFRLNEARLLAEKGELTARKNLYAADMGVVQEAIADGRRSYAHQRLVAHFPAPGQRDLRGWEWRYFWKQNQSEKEATLSRHSVEVRSIRVSPRGNWVLSSDLDGTVELWDVAQATNVLTLRNAGLLLAFSADERFMYFAQKTQGIRTWSLADMQERRPVIETNFKVQALECDPNTGHLIVVGGGILNVIDPESGQVLTHYAVPTGTEVQVSANGHWVAACADTHTVQLWDQTTGSVRPLETQHVFAGGHPLKMAFSPDGTMLVATVARTTGGNFRVQAWDTATARIRIDYPTHKDHIVRVAVSPDGQFVATAGYDQEIEVRETNEWQLVNPPIKLEQKCSALAFLPGSSRLLAGDIMGRVNQFTLATKFNHLELPKEATAGLLDDTSGCASPDYSRLILMRSGGTGLVVDTLRSRITQEFTLPWRDVAKVAVTPDASLLACSRTNGLLELWRLGQGTNLCEFKLKDQRPAARIAFAPNSRWLATFNGTDSLQLWDVSEQRELSAWPKPIRKIRALRFSPDSRWLACGEETGKITLWEVETAKLLFKLSGHKFGMNDLAFSPDGLRLASTGWDTRARLWDLRSKEQIAEFFGCRSSFFRAVFSPDGSRLLLSEWGDTFVFEIQAERQVARLKSFMPVFVDNDTLLGLNTYGVEHLRAPSLEEIDAAFSRESAASGKAMDR